MLELVVADDAAGTSVMYGGAAGAVVLLIGSLIAAWLKLRSDRRTQAKADVELTQDQREGAIKEWRDYAKALNKQHAEDITRLEEILKAKDAELATARDALAVANVTRAQYEERLRWKQEYIGDLEREVESLKDQLDKAGIRPRGGSAKGPFGKERTDQSSDPTSGGET